MLWPDCWPLGCLSTGVNAPSWPFPDSLLPTLVCRALKLQKESPCSFNRGRRRLQHLYHCRRARYCCWSTRRKALFEGSSPYSEVALSDLEMETSPCSFFGCSMTRELWDAIWPGEETKEIFRRADDFLRDIECAGSLKECNSLKKIRVLWPCISMETHSWRRCLLYFDASHCQFDTWSHLFFWCRFSLFRRYSWFCIN